MWKDFNFLFEIGCEEIPAGYIPAAINNYEKFFIESFKDKRILFKEVKVFATPRRFVVVASELADFQKDEVVELKGPSADKAYDSNNKPTKALEGFLRGNSLQETDVEIRETDKGKYIFASKKAESRKTVEIIPGIIKDALEKVSFPKKMKWNTKSILFPRPIRYIVLMFNDGVVDFEIEGLKADNMTRGHYVQNQGLMDIEKISEYNELLRKHNVILDQDERKALILELLTEASKKLNTVLVDDEDLLNTVTYIAENPNIVTCTFKDEFLQIPDIVLITEMREHQKYFALRDKNGKLSNKFLVISNIPETDFIKEGNQRVITARFNDAQFFFNEDRKTPLFEKVESLKNVLFHKDLGTIYNKIERVMNISEKISNRLDYNTGLKDKIKRAVLLSKADLNTSLVYEFTSLQGQIGKIYALLDGEDEEVANAIDEHYKPRFQGDDLPKNSISIVLSLSEKIDNLFGSFSVGNIPKGSQDPYALRRQSHAIVDILIKNSIKINVKDLLADVAEQYKNGKELIGKLIDFISTRANTIFQNSGFKHDEVEAVMSSGNTDYYELYLRARSLNEFRKDENFSQMLLSFKRINNIISAFYKKNKGYDVSFNEDLFVESSEKDLYKFFNERSEKINEYIVNNKYHELFTVLTEGKTPIDKFFDDVLVMVDDVKLRDNRVACLEKIINPFATLIDFSKLSE